MARINLLPWRAERRELRKREFFVQLGVAAAVAIVVVILWGLFMDARIGNQNDRNDYLSGEIKQLDAKIAEIKDLQKTKSQLLARKQIIEQLQENRAQMVHLFDELVKTIPDGARLTSFKQNGDTLTLDGVAQSNATVADYMRKVEASPWLGSADLIRTENKHNDSRTPYQFELVVHLGKPAPAGASSTATAASSGAPPASASTATSSAASAATSNGGAAQ
ncbi:MAG TPA: PilN domain-containing protein [Rhodanobacteraceae bacterium]|nr:PilN domain-containing protein [Rhodanobacteraceae bacterium]